MFRALMVDVDGVLVRGRPQDAQHWSSSLEVDLGLSPMTLHENFFAPYWSDVITGKQGLVERLTPVLQKVAPHLSAQDLIDYWFANDAQLDQALIADIDCQRAKGVKVYLATNQEHLRARYLIEELGLGQHCDGIYYSAAVGVQKPDRQFFERVAVSSCLPRGELLFVDDLQENVRAARDAGWQAMHWTAGKSMAKALDDHEWK